MLQDYFDKVYLINLPEQKERLSSSYSECDKFGIKFDLFKAKSFTIIFSGLIQKNLRE